MKKVPEPLNANEMYLHGINLRLEVIVNQLSSICEFLANQNGGSVEENKIEDVLPLKRKRKGG